jgi:hypothetical protein
VELDAAVAGGFGPAELACVPFDEGLGFRRDVEVLVEAGVGLADLGVSVLDQQPTTRTSAPVEQGLATIDAALGGPDARDPSRKSRTVDSRLASV